MMFDDFKTWCEMTGNKPSHYSALKEFVDGFKDGTLVKCDCCGVYTKQEHMHRARYDYEREVCEQCRTDGN